MTRLPLTAAICQCIYAPWTTEAHEQVFWLAMMSDTFCNENIDWFKWGLAHA